MKSLSAILRWIAYPVEPFGFVFVQDGLPPSLPDRIHNRLGQQQGLFDQLDGGKTKMLQCVHGWMDPNAPQWRIVAPPGVPRNGFNACF